MAFPVIAIDGPSASGKGTLARSLASALDFAWLETGLLYRAVGWLMISQKQDLDNEQAAKAAVHVLKESLQQSLDILGAPQLRDEATGGAASRISLLPAVREDLLQLQRDFAAKPPGNKKGAILDGRDIGTLICPEAPVKLFVIASADIRAERRVKELQILGIEANYAAVLADIKARDERDSTRPIAPLKPAPDAVTIDTSHMTANDVLSAALKVIAEKLPSAINL